MKVQLWGKSEKTHNFDAQVGVSHAQIGRPVDITFSQGNNSNRIHISEEQAVELYKQLGAIVRAIG